MERWLRLLLIQAHLDLTEISNILIQVSFVQSLDLLHSIVSDIELLAKFIDLNLFSLHHLVTALPFLLKLQYTATETIEIFQHDQPLYIRQRLLCIVVKGLWCLLFAKSRPDYVLDALRWQELVLDELQVRLISSALQFHIGTSVFKCNLLLGDVLITTDKSGTFDTLTILVWLRSISSMLRRTSTEVSQTMIIPVDFSGWLGHFRWSGATTGISFHSSLSLHLFWEFAAILWCKRLLLQVWMRNSLILIISFISSVVVRAIVIIFVGFLDVAKIGRFIDLANSTATATHSITSYRSVLHRNGLMVWRTASGHVDNLIKWVVSAFLSHTSCTCRAIRLSEFRNLVLISSGCLVTFGWDWAERTCCHCSLLNGSDSLLKVKDRVDRVISSLLVWEVLYTLLLQTEKSLADNF